MTEEIQGVRAVASSIDERQQRFLAQAAMLLASSLDYQETLHRIAELVVPALADWCSIDLLEDGGIRNVAMRHADPAKVDLARRLQREYPADPNAPTGAPAVIRSGRPELYEEIPDGLLVENARDARQLQIARELRLGSAIVTPLPVRGRTIGALTLIAEGDRRFDGRDLAFAQEVARLAAAAVGNAQLYELQVSALADAEEAREQAQRLADRLRRLQTIIDSTFISGSSDELLVELLGRLREAVGSDTAAILTVNETGDELVLRRAIGFEEATGARVPIGEGFAGTIGATLTHLVVPDVSELEVVTSHLQSSGIVSLAGVPLVTDGRLVGVVHVGSKHRREFDREDILLLRLVAGRAAVAIDRAREHEREHRIAEVLQRSLLPERLPALPGVEVAARYVPGTVGVAVGGDWYDVFELGDGSIGIAVGDVVGHGVRAAAAMGRLRNVLHVYAVEGFGPADALERLNRLACAEGEETFATVVYALVAPSRRRIRIASAGHPPPLLRTPDGEVSILEEGRSVPVGAMLGTSYTEADLRVAPGSTLILYTDGLVERRGESIDAGIERLVGLVEEPSGSLDELADRIVDRLADAEYPDDVALLGVELERVGAEPLSLRFPAHAEELAPMRRSLRSWLEGCGAGRAEIFDILVAVNEACSNAVEHPIGATRPEVTVDAELADSCVAISIRDSGRWRMAGNPGDRGRGLHFMEALMDGVDVRRSSEGTSIQLRRRLRSGAG